MRNDDIRLEHALLTVRSLEATLGFYGRLFPDWIVRWRDDGAGGGRWIHFGAPGHNQSGYLSLYENPQAGEAGKAYTTLRVQHLGFTHPDVGALVRRLSEAGIEPHLGPMDEEGFRRSYYHDPDGHQLEFVQKL